MVRRALDLLSLTARRLRRRQPRFDPSELDPSAAYELLADWYDWSGALDFAESTIAASASVERLHGFAPASLLDLACGTGTYLVARAREGVACTGVDRSLAMLEVARAKADEARVPIALVCADLRHPAIGRRFDLVTCFYDALNHLTRPDDLRRALAGAAALLAPGGLLMFDTSNECMYERLWSDGVQEIPVRDATVRIAYRYDRSTRLGVARLSLLRARLPILEALVAERCHPLEEIEDALSAAGLVLVSRQPHPHFDGEATALKDLWVCRLRA